MMSPGGKRIAITRSAEGNTELGRKLEEMRFIPIVVDTISFQPPLSWIEVDAVLRGLSEYDWLILTSVTGVRYFVERMKALGLRVPWDGGPSIAAVGGRTAGAIRSTGLGVDFVPSRYLTEVLGEELPLRGKGKALLLRSDKADRTLTVRLKERGFSVSAPNIYRTIPVLSEAEGLDRADAIVFASTFAVETLCGMVPGVVLEHLRGKRAYCIGPVTAKAAKAHGFSRTVVPTVHTIDSLLKELERAGPDD